MATRKKSKMTGALLLAAAAALGAWFHAPILDKLHGMGIAKDHA